MDYASWHQFKKGLQYATRCRRCSVELPAGDTTAWGQKTPSGRWTFVCDACHLQEQQIQRINEATAHAAELPKPVTPPPIGPFAPTDASTAGAGSSTMGSTAIPDEFDDTIAVSTPNWPDVYGMDDDGQVFLKEEKPEPEKKRKPLFERLREEARWRFN